MMKKQKPLFTNLSASRTKELIVKMSSLIDKSIPSNVYGMLATAKPIEGTSTIVFYNRYHLISNQPHDYSIYDSFTDNVLYENVTLFTSAINIIYAIAKRKVNSGFVDREIYSLDQQYYRCINNIRFYKHSLKKADKERSVTLLNRLSDDEYRLKEIKTRLYKIF